MKTILILPNVNNIDFTGRVYTAPSFNHNGTRVTFSVIRNFGGDKEPVILNFVAFKTAKKEFPEFLKKGAAVTVHAYFNPDVYTDKDGEEVRKTQFVVKTIEEAEVKDGKIEGVNNIDFAGRLTADPVINAAGTCAMFTLIRNFGGDKAPVALGMTMLRKADGPAFPECLKKGSPVVARAFFNPAVFTNKDGEEVKRVQFVIKDIKPAELVERRIKDGEPVDADAEPTEIQEA